jgi:membrane fusion protein (multidrug efflux system)
MALDVREAERGEQTPPERSAAVSWSPKPLEIARPAPDAGTDALGRAPAPDARPAGESRVSEAPAGREDPSAEAQHQRKPLRPPRRRLALALGLLLSIPLVAGGYLYWDYSRHFQSTDDAFIAARAFSVAPKVSGYITTVPVTDNQHVAAGQVIARIDDRDYRAALEQAQAQVAAAQAAVQNVEAQISVQQAQIGSSQAQVAQAQATLAFAQQQAARYQDLARSGAGSVQNAEQYVSQLRQQQAALASAQATLKVAQRQIESLKAQHESAVANLAQARAQRDQAQLNLSYTTVRAAQAGRVANLSAAIGQFAQPGTNIATFVPDEIWVAANFKETQLDAMRPGQPATVHIDAYPERAIRGRVASVQPGSGTAFSLLPAENATGNWVKVIQRVPVKIVMDSPPADVALGPGMSVEADVRVNPNPSLYEQLRAWL